MRAAAPLSPASLDLLSVHFGLARAIARRTHRRLPPGVDLDDLVGVAVMGLVEAVERFDAGRGVSFESYAKHRIQGAILDSLRAQDWVPRAVRRRAEQIEGARKDLARELGRDPQPEEVAARLGLEVDALRATEVALDTRPLLSLDAAPADGEPGALVELARVEEDDAERRLADRQLRDLTRRAIEELPERERVAVVLFYFRELSLKEVGGVLGVSESRACQLCSQATKRLRTTLRAAVGA